MRIEGSRAGDSPHARNWQKERREGDGHAKNIWAVPRAVAPIAMITREPGIHNEPDDPPTGRWNDEFLKDLAANILPGYLPTCRWFGRKSDVIREVAI